MINGNHIFKVGGKDFEIKILTYDELQTILLNFGVESQLKVGFIDYFMQIIYVRNDVNKDLQNECVLHELIHAMLLDSGIESLSENMGEIISTIIAPRLLQLLKDNKKQLDFIE
jgi:hypothetical protein